MTLLVLGELGQLLDDLLPLFLQQYLLHLVTNTKWTVSHRRWDPLAKYKEKG